MTALYFKAFFNKNRLKKIFRLLLAVQICCTSPPIYSAEAPNDIPDIKIQELKKIIRKMAEHQSTGTFNEFAQDNYMKLIEFTTTVNTYFEKGIYREQQASPFQQNMAMLIQNNPFLIPAIDYFMIADQEVHLIESYF